MKKAQMNSQIFIIIGVLAVVGLIVLVGYKAINTAQTTVTRQEVTQFRIALSSDMKKLAPDYGTSVKKQYSLDKKFKVACFISSDTIDEVPKDLVEKYPVIKVASLELENNVFLIGENTYDSFYIKDLGQSSSCVPIDNGILSLDLLGLGDSAVARPNSLSVSENVNPGTQGKTVKIIPEDFQMALTIPKGASVTYPSGNAGKITVEKDNSPVQIKDKTILAAYKMTPDGLKFSPDATVELYYDPNVIYDPASLEVQEYYDSSWHILSSSVDSTRHVIKAKISHFSSIALVVECFKLKSKDTCKSNTKCSWIGNSASSTSTAATTSTADNDGFCTIPQVPTDACKEDDIALKLELDDKATDPVSSLKVSGSSTKPLTWVVLQIAKDSSTPVTKGDVGGSRITKIGSRYYWKWDSDNFGLLRDINGRYDISFMKECTSNVCSPGKECVKITIEGDSAKPPRDGVCLRKDVSTTIVIFGDSITKSYSTSELQKLNEKLKEDPLTKNIKVLAKGYESMQARMAVGEEILGGNDGKGTLYDYFSNEIVKMTPDAVIFWFGMNVNQDEDSLHKAPMKRMIQKAKEEKIISMLMTVIPVCGNPYTDTRTGLVPLPSCKKESSAISQVQREKVAEIDRGLSSDIPETYIIDAREKLQDKFKTDCCSAYYTNDGGHLQPNGETLVTNLLFEKMKTWALSSSNGPFNCPNQPPLNARYKCNTGGSCTEDASGTFASRQSCESQCRPASSTSLKIIYVRNESTRNDTSFIRTNASEPVTTKVYFGTNKNLLTNFIQNSGYSNSSLVYLTGLKNNTLYFYNVTSCALSGRCIDNGTFNFTTSQNGSFEIYNKKVMIITFNPVISGTRKLIEFKNYNDPTRLINEYVSKIKEASHGKVNYLISEKIEVNLIPQKKDGFSYTISSYLDCLNGVSPCHSPDYTDYDRILNTYNVCEKRNSGEIDELWLIGGPWFGFYESNMAGPGWNTNGPVITSTCIKPLHIMGFNYEKTVAEMLHDMGHRVEGTMRHFNPEDYSKFSGEEFRYSESYDCSGTHTALNTQNAHCGSTHFPPNTNCHYNTTSTLKVMSDCDNWYNYPWLGTQKKEISCSEWDCSEESYQVWWLSHLPKHRGKTNDKYNDWWKYIVDIP